MTILEEVFAERKHQDDLWGYTFDDKNNPNDWVAYIVRYASEGAYDGRDSKFTPARFRKFLIQAAALCIAAIEAIDRNGGTTVPRHYGV